MPRSISDEEIDQMVAEDLADEQERRDEITLIAVRIRDSNADPMLKQALLQMLRLLS